jgi:hypothetical protein
MGHRSGVREGRDFRGFCALVLVCVALFWSSPAFADPGRGGTDPSAEPKRSYGAIEVILYQTNW